MSYPTGQLVSAPLSNGFAGAEFGTHISYLGTGGYRELATLADRDAIPTKSVLEYDGLGSGQRRHLMLVAVQETSTIYILAITDYAELGDEDRLAALVDNGNWLTLQAYLNVQPIGGGLTPQQAQMLQDALPAPLQPDGSRTIAEGTPVGFSNEGADATTYYFRTYSDNAGFFFVSKSGETEKVLFSCESGRITLGMKASVDYDDYSQQAETDPFAIIRKDFLVDYVEGKTAWKLLPASTAGNSNNISLGTFNNAIPTGEFFGNVFLGAFTNNTFEDDCIGNTIGGNCSHNSFRFAFIGNNIGHAFYNNTIGVAFRGNIIGPQFSSNIVGDGMQDCVVGNNCTHLNIGEGCTNMKIIDCRGTPDNLFEIPPYSSGCVFINNQLVENSNGRVYYEGSQGYTIQISGGQFTAMPI